MSIETFLTVTEDIKTLLDKEINPGISLLAQYNTGNVAVYSGSPPTDLRITSPGIEIIVDDCTSDSVIEFFGSTRVESMFKISLHLWQPWHISETLDVSQPKMLSLFEPLAALGNVSPIKACQHTSKYRYRQIGSKQGTEQAPQMASFYWVAEPSVCNHQAIA